MKELLVLNWYYAAIKITEVILILRQPFNGLQYCLMRVRKNSTADCATAWEDCLILLLNPILIDRVLITGWLVKHYKSWFQKLLKQFIALLVINVKHLVPGKTRCFKDKLRFLFDFWLLIFKFRRCRYHGTTACEKPLFHCRFCFWALNLFKR
jgi:hypothetical protein